MIITHHLSWRSRARWICRIHRLTLLYTYIARSSTNLWAAFNAANQVILRALTTFCANTICHKAVRPQLLGSPELDSPIPFQHQRDSTPGSSLHHRIFWAEVLRMASPGRWKSNNLEPWMEVGSRRRPGYQGTRQRRCFEWSVEGSGAREIDART
ncbi:hypothetical protein BKA80DRAFT_269216 [Phyllosticta citrichinensis]